MNHPQLVHRTPVEDCAACQSRRLHTPEDWEKHPMAGHGFMREIGWTHELLKSKEKGK